MNQQSSRIGGTADKVGIYAGDRWETNDERRAFWPIRRNGDKLHGIERYQSAVRECVMPFDLNIAWRLAAENDTPPPLPGEPLPERPKERPTRIGRTALELHESGDGPREGDVWEGKGGARRLVLDRGDETVDADGDLLVERAQCTSEIGRVSPRWIFATWRLIAEGRDESNWLDVVEENEESEPDDDTPLAESRRQFDAALEEADPMVRIGDLVQRASKWRDGVLDLNDQDDDETEESDNWAARATIPQGDWFAFSSTADRNTLRALFGVEPLE